MNFSGETFLNLKTNWTSNERPGQNRKKRPETLTYVPGRVALDLAAPDEVPDARHPVRQQGERGHEQREHHGAVLGVPVQLLQEAQEAQEAHRFQQVNPEILREDENTA